MQGSGLFFFEGCLLQRIKAALAGSGHSPGAGWAARCIHGAFSLGWRWGIAGSQGGQALGAPVGCWEPLGRTLHAPSPCFPPPTAPSLSSAGSSGHPASSRD